MTLAEIIQAIKDSKYDVAEAHLAKDPLSTDDIADEYSLRFLQKSIILSKVLAEGYYYTATFLLRNNDFLDAFCDNDGFFDNLLQSKLLDDTQKFALFKQVVQTGRTHDCDGNLKISLLHAPKHKKWTKYLEFAIRHGISAYADEKLPLNLMVAGATLENYAVAISLAMEAFNRRNYRIPKHLIAFCYDKENINLINTVKNTYVHGSDNSQRTLLSMVIYAATRITHSNNNNELFEFAQELIEKYGATFAACETADVQRYTEQFLQRVIKDGDIEKLRNAFDSKEFIIPKQKLAEFALEATFAKQEKIAQLLMGKCATNNSAAATDDFYDTLYRMVGEAVDQGYYPLAAYVMDTFDLIAIHVNPSKRQNLLMLAVIRNDKAEVLNFIEFNGFNFSHEAELALLKARELELTEIADMIEAKRPMSVARIMSYATKLFSSMPSSSDDGNRVSARLATETTPLIPVQSARPYDNRFFSI